MSLCFFTKTFWRVTWGKAQVWIIICCFSFGVLVLCMQARCYTVVASWDTQIEQIHNWCDKRFYGKSKRVYSPIHKGLWNIIGCKGLTNCVLSIQAKWSCISTLLTRVSHIETFSIFKRLNILLLNCDTACVLHYFFLDSVMPYLPSRHCQKFPAAVKSPDCSYDRPPACTAAAHLLVSSPGYIEGS